MSKCSCVFDNVVGAPPDVSTPGSSENKTNPTPSSDSDSPAITSSSGFGVKSTSGSLRYLHPRQWAALDRGLQDCAALQDRFQIGGIGNLPFCIEANQSGMLGQDGTTVRIGL